jgi:hypothetical protein
MPKRSSKPKVEDVNEAAYRVVAEATGGASGTEINRPKRAKRKNPAAVALGRTGGLKGGKARAASLTPEERQRIASKAAEARWRKPER